MRSRHGQGNIEQDEKENRMELTRKNLEDQLRSNKCILKSYKLDLIEFHDNDHIKSHIERYSNKIKAIESALESMKQDSIQE